MSMSQWTGLSQLRSGFSLMFHGIVGWCFRNTDAALSGPYWRDCFRHLSVGRNTMFSPLPHVHLAGILAVIPETY